MRARLYFFCAVLAVAAGISQARADAKIPPMPNPPPPGMTAAVWKMIFTPGPAHPAGIPADAQSFLGCIPTMGYHYVNPENAPFGPIYGWYNGKPTFTEVMVAKSDFVSGKSWNELLKPLPGYAIDHVDIWWEPNGHPGYTAPHYDIHAWYIPHAAHMTFCNNPSGKTPAWLAG